MSSTAIQEAITAALEAQTAGDLVRAEAVYREVLRIDPANAQATHLLGIVAFQAGYPTHAVELMDRAVRLSPATATYHYNLAHVLEKLDRFDESTAHYRQAVHLAPHHVPSRDELAALLLRQRPVPLDEIETHASASLACGPDNPDALFMLGVVASQRDQDFLAQHFLERAIALRPDFAMARWYRSLILLERGEYQEGWREYEWRLLGPGMVTGPVYPHLKWDGSDVRGKRVLVTAEQGFGDVIQSLRYLPMLAERGARVFVGCAAPLERLVRAMPGVEQVVSSGDAMPEFDLQVAVLSFPHLFATTLQTIPARIPYIPIDPTLLQKWTERLGPRTGELRVGICLAGNREGAPGRECPSELMAPLESIPNVVLYNLQKAEPAGRILRTVDFTAELSDFAETAALMEQLDLVISIDTSVAHLAGALGKRTWTMLPYGADWRWMRDGETTPWYPTMHLFRQKSKGDWDEVTKRVIQATMGLSAPT